MGSPYFASFQTIWKKMESLYLIQTFRGHRSNLEWLPLKLIVFRQFAKRKKIFWLEPNFHRTWQHFWNRFPLISLFSDNLKEEREQITFLSLRFQRIQGHFLWLPFNFAIQIQHQQSTQRWNLTHSVSKQASLSIVVNISEKCSKNGEVSNGRPHKHNIKTGNNLHPGHRSWREERGKGPALTKGVEIFRICILKYF